MTMRTMAQVFTLALASAVVGAAQGTTGKWNAEIVGFGGANGGLPSLTDAFAEGIALGGGRDVRVQEGSKLRWLGGGGIGVSLTDHIIVTSELAYNRLGSSTMTFLVPGRSTSVSAGMRANLWDFTGGMQFQFPNRGNKAVPYFGAAVGIARASASGDVPGVSSDVGASESDLAANFGGGVRLYFSENWGMRPEVKVVRLPGETFVRASLGLFYQFR